MTQYVMKLFEDPERDQFRVIDRDGEPWFVASEVCQKLGIANTSDAVSRLDDDERMTLGIAESHSGSRGGARSLLIINESGLYSIMLRSRVPGAKKFKKWVTSEVLPSIRKTGGYRAKVPAFIQRANQNWDRVEPGYFSVINELAVMVWGRMERAGHIMADNAPNGRQNRPDGSVGKGFAKWLDDHHPSVNGNYKFYPHQTPEIEIDARQYPNSMLPLFREYVETVWWPTCFAKYIGPRDPKALEYLQKLLPPSRKAS